MDLSVVIVCYKGWNKLTRCLEALRSFNMCNFSMEVIVVDNNSDDEEINELERSFPAFRIIRNKVNGGYAYGCNTGARAAAGDFILILNPDTVVTEDAVSKLIEKIKANPEFFIISCKQNRSDGTVCKAYGDFPGLNLRHIKPQKRESGDLLFPGWVSGSLMLMKRTTFVILDGFDEHFWMYYEDVDICMRARKAGGKVAFFNDIAIEHNHGGSSRINLITTSKTKGEVQASRHVYIQKHLRGPERFLLHSLTVADNLVTGIIAGIFGLIFFFIPKLFVRIFILAELLKYYSGSLTRMSWLSPRSVLFQRGGRQ